MTQQTEKMTREELDEAEGLVMFQRGLSRDGIDRAFELMLKMFHEIKQSRAENPNALS